MSLTSALNTAQSIFSNTGTQSSVVSNNISNSSNSDYVRRQAMITTSLNGAQVVKISRAQEDALMRQWLKASAQDSGQQTLLGGLTDLKSIMGGNDYETSPANYLATFREKLQAFRTSPSSTIAAQSAVGCAGRRQFAEQRDEICAGGTPGRGQGNCNAGFDAQYAARAVQDGERCRQERNGNGW